MRGAAGSIILSPNQREGERGRELLKDLAVASFPSAFGPELFLVVLHSMYPQLKFCGMNVIRCLVY